MPKIGGFSPAKVPRPRQPLSRLRRPGRPFVHGGGVALMTGYNIDFITLDFTLKRNRFLLVDEALPQVRGHLLHIVFIQTQLLGNLLVGKIEVHEIQTQNPGP